MWGLFVGVVIGALQVAALSVLGRMIIHGSNTSKLLGSLLLLVKIAVIVLALYIISTISLTHLIWTAGGMLAGLIAALVFIQARRGKKEKASDSHTDGKDNSDG